MPQSLPQSAGGQCLDGRGDLSGRFLMGPGTSASVAWGRYTRFVRWISAAVAFVWLGCPAAGLACAMTCAISDRPAQATVPVPPVHGLAHQHHVTMPDAGTLSPLRTPAGLVGAPSHHACNESQDLPARLAIPSGPRVEKTARVKAGAPELALAPGGPVVFQIDRWHQETAFSPPRPAQRPLVLRI